jgi:hypothetical protein
MSGGRARKQPQPKAENARSSRRPYQPYFPLPALQPSASRPGGWLKPSRLDLLPHLRKMLDQPEQRTRVEAISGESANVLVFDPDLPLNGSSEPLPDQLRSFNICARSTSIYARSTAALVQHLPQQPAPGPGPGEAEGD